MVLIQEKVLVILITFIDGGMVLKLTQVKCKFSHTVLAECLNQFHFG